MSTSATTTGVPPAFPGQSAFSGPGAPPPSGFSSTASAPLPPPPSVAPSPSLPGGGPRLPASLTVAAQGFGGRLSSGFRSAYSYATGRGLTTILVVVLGVGVFAALAFTVYQILSTSLKVVTLLDEPKHAISQAKTVSGDKLPPMKNGKEFSLSFWVYIEAQTNTAALKQVLAVGDSADALSPLVVMDRATNRMYIAMRTMQMNTTESAMSTLAAVQTYADSRKTMTSSDSNSSSLDSKPTYSECAILEVEYVPLARWLNLVVVLDNDLLTLYLDGDIYSVTPVIRFSANGVVVDPKGSLSVGGTNGVSGYVSNVQIANYAFSVFHARAIYRAGPVKRSLAWLLPNNVKLQWPITTVRTDA